MLFSWRGKASFTWKCWVVNERVLVCFPLDKPHQHEHSLSTYFLFPSHCIRSSKEKRLGTLGLGNTSDVSSLPHTQVLKMFVGGVEGCMANPSALCSCKGKWVQIGCWSPAELKINPIEGLRNVSPPSFQPRATFISVSSCKHRLASCKEKRILAAGVIFMLSCIC